jgi:ferredoxin--NADP+ reductase
MSNLTQQQVLSVHHWTDRLFSFTTTRDPAFRFENGQFAMIGLEVDGKPLLRAYSVVSPNYDEMLEFLSIKVQGGPLTSRLQHLAVGDNIVMGRKATGTLLLANVRPGRNLYLVSTGTGLAPFMSLIRDPETFERYERVVLVHGCRQIAELAYKDQITEEFPANEYFGGLLSERLIYYPTVTREPFRNRGRITDLMCSGTLFSDIGLPSISAERDRAMLCGSPALIADMRNFLESLGMAEGNNASPGEYVVEKAFAEKA